MHNLKKGSNKVIDFISLAKPFGFLSLLLVVGSIVAISTIGFNYGIDFAGGTEVQVKFNQPVTAEEIRTTITGLGITSSSVQKFGTENEFLVRFEVAKGSSDTDSNKKNNELIKTVSDGFKTSFQSAGIEIRRVDSVGPQIGDELKRNGLLAVFYSLLMILLYVGLRFDYKYAPSAVICLFHDALITLGVFALLGKQINVQILAAVLTIIGYSLNDTIVTFDRVRENEAAIKGKGIAHIINKSITDVLSRTILTSVTTFLAVMALYFIAGGVIQDFAFALAIGVLVGTYSSIYVASPLVLFFDRFQNPNKHVDESNKNNTAARTHKKARA